MIETLYKVCHQSGCSFKEQQSQCMLCFNCGDHESACPVPEIEAENEGLLAYKAAWEEAYDKVPPSATYGLGEESETDLLDEIAAKHGIVEAQQ